MGNLPYSKSGSEWSPLTKIKKEVQALPPPQESISTSPLEEIFFTYTMPIETIQGLKEMELRVITRAEEEVMEISAEEVTRKLEEEFPLIVEKAIEKKRVVPEQVYIIKIEGRSVSREKTEVRGEEVKEERAKGFRVNEIEILIRIIWGEGKLIIELPPLTPEEFEKLIRMLETLMEKVGRGQIAAPK